METKELWASEEWKRIFSVRGTGIPGTLGTPEAEKALEEHDIFALYVEQHGRDVRGWGIISLAGESLWAWTTDDGIPLSPEADKKYQEIIQSRKFLGRIDENGLNYVFTFYGIMEETEALKSLRLGSK